MSNRTPTPAPDAFLEGVFMGFALGLGISALLYVLTH